MRVLARIADGRVLRDSALILNLISSAVRLVVGSVPMLFSHRHFRQRPRPLRLWVLLARSVVEVVRRPPIWLAPDQTVFLHLVRLNLLR